MIGVILAAGDGTRLMTCKNENCCKPLIQLNKKPLIAYALDNLVSLEITEAYIVIGKKGDLIKNAIGDEYEDIKIHYIYQQEQKGLINALAQALKVIDNSETVVLQLSDEIFINFNTDLIKNALNTMSFDYYCGVTAEENPEKIKNNFSVETDNDSIIIKCIEKPKEIINNIKGTGFSIFNDEALGLIKNVYENNPEKLFDLCDCFNYLTSTGHNGLAISVADREFNINTMTDLTEAEGFLQN